MLRKHPGFHVGEVQLDLGLDGLARLLLVRSVVSRGNNLLEAKCNYHAKNNNPNLACKLAPAVKRLWKMDVHAEAPEGFGYVTGAR